MIQSLITKLCVLALKYGGPVLLGIGIFWGVDHSYRTLKDKATVAEQENIELQKAVNAQSQRADAAESNVKTLTSRLQVVQAANADYQKRQHDLEEKQGKENEAAKKEAAQLSRGLTDGHVSDSRVPDSVIRLQQQAICRANGDCSSQ